MRERGPKEGLLAVEECVRNAMRERGPKGGLGAVCGGALTRAARFEVVRDGREG